MAVEGLSGFFKVLPGRRAMQLRPRETEGLKEGRQGGKRGEVTGTLWTAGVCGSGVARHSVLEGRT